jgi:AraC family transcriptional regulator of adaptative response/methylated-DNA-[protein]-cysteine methyltransferase
MQAKRIKQETPQQDAGCAAPLAGAGCSQPRNQENGIMDGNATFYDALVARDSAADGVFLYAVKTTGIYCRPPCPARTPLPKNIEFFPTPTAAQAAGYRPCKRCRPDGTPIQHEQAALIAAACRRIATSETALSLAALAEEARLSPFHFHRLFKSTIGVTPKAYAASLRAEKTQKSLGSARSVTAAIYEAGYESSSRFYADAPAHLGMAPATYRKGAPGERIRVATAPCALGHVLVAATATGVCAITLGDDPATLKTELTRQFPHAKIEPADATLLSTIVALVEGTAPTANLPLDIRGTAFQQRVWAALRAIPPGQTVSYAQIAEILGAPKAARAVAAACAANRLAIAIPCHRVIRGDGDLAGYRWGITRKRALLARESKP